MENTQKPSVAVVVLAAGHGKRMQSETPKVLSLLHGKPLIIHLLENIKKAGICEMPVIVVGQRREQIMEALGPSYTYVVQEEQLGTGHAVKCTAEALKDRAENVMVLYGDMPYFSPETMRKTAELHIEEGNDMTMGTVTIPDFNDWRQAFMSFGRISRDTKGKVQKIIYGKNLTEEELAITEVDPAYFTFKTSWLWPHLEGLKNENSHREYYLTDLLGMAFNEGAKLGTVAIDPKEAIGVNTKENLELLHKL